MHALEDDLKLHEGAFATGLLNDRRFMFGGQFWQFPGDQQKGSYDMYPVRVTGSIAAPEGVAVAEGRGGVYVEWCRN